ncbi:hypothetical protein Q1695_004075 [Nippostrongylus brasiliensis]|nr:hypothetical protein Q1695_004075 [Nippostrongylus brasiliensis]
MRFAVLGLFFIAVAVKPSSQDNGDNCPENEEFLQCGTACEPSCRNPNPIVCTLQCIVNVCQCRKGFFRDSNGKCVSKCDNSTCGTNEVLMTCGTACEPTCFDPVPFCTKQCVSNVCQCKPGFIRDALHNCIPKESCSTNATSATPASCAELKCPAVCEVHPSQEISSLRWLGISLSDFCDHSMTENPREDHSSFSNDILHYLAL